MRMRNAISAVLFMGVASMVGCVVDGGEPGPGQPAEGAEARGPIGKADLWGSCAGQAQDHCGGISDGNCWCDDSCSYWGDCCDDKMLVCDGCDDPADPAVHYRSEDPQQCAAMHFICDADQSPFFNPCGCGCKDDEPPPEPQSCGGFAGLTCDIDQWCDYESTSCGYADQMGVCKPRPEACSMEIDPVCGCDNKTYSNACHAQTAGVDVRFDGECGCIESGCPDGRYCTYCWGTFQCIPDGALC